MHETGNVAEHDQCAVHRLKSTAGKAIAELVSKDSDTVHERKYTRCTQLIHSLIVLRLCTQLTHSLISYMFSLFAAHSVVGIKHINTKK